MRVDIHPAAGHWVTAQVEDWFRGQLGPVILDDARRMVPVRTGALYRSLRVEVAAGEMRIGSDLPYTAVVELGIDRTVGSGTRRRRMRRAPQPYLRPALYRPRTP